MEVILTNLQKSAILAVNHPSGFLILMARRKEYPAMTLDKKVSRRLRFSADFFLFKLTDIEPRPFLGKLGTLYDFP